MKRIIGFIIIVTGVIVVIAAGKSNAREESGEMITYVRVSNTTEESYISFWSPLDSTKYNADYRIRDYFVSIHGDFSLFQILTDGNVDIVQCEWVTPTFIKRVLPGQTFCYKIEAPVDKQQYCQSHIMFVPEKKVKFFIHDIDIPQWFLFAGDTALLKYKYINKFFDIPQK